MIIGYILGGFIIYFLYKFIVGFVLPVVRTTTAMKRKMEQMRQPSQTRTHSNKSNKVHAESQGPVSDQFSKTKDVFGKFHQATGKPRKADYIDFEEIEAEQDANRP